MDLVAENLACVRAGRRVFAGVSFAVRAGEAATLRGPNGSGKSTLLRVLAGLLAPEAGDARMGGVSLRADPEGFAETALYAGHLDAVKPALTVEENLRFWARLYGGGRPVWAALERFGLARIAAYPAAYCSAGQKRRLGLARLMVVDRPLWLLDEPTVSLDAASTAIFAGVVREHLAAGGVAIAATHVPVGLEGGPEIAMGGGGPAAAPADDPFLAGSWT